MIATLEMVLARAPRLYRSVLVRRGRPDGMKVALAHLVRRGDVVLDVGANLGRYTRVLANLTGSRGRVHGFEPVRGTFERLTRGLGRKRNVSLYQQALSAQAGEMAMFTPAGDGAQSSLVKHGGAGSWANPERVAEEKVRVTTLDEFAGEVKLDQLNFVKVDIEGAEPLFLRGGAKTLGRFRPLILMEVNSGWLRSHGETPAGVGNFLRELGYNYFYEPEVDGRRFRFKPREFEVEMNTDVLCSPSVRGDID